MKIYRLSMALGMENDVERNCNVKHIIVPASFVNVIMPRRHAQYGVFYNLHSATVYFSLFHKFPR